MPVLGKTKKEVLAEFRSSEILEAAKKVFSSKGFNDATVDDVAEAAGIAKGTIYLYFPSKREIFVEVVRQGIIALHAETARRVNAAETTGDKILAFIETRMDFSESDREFYRLYYAEYSNLLTSPAMVGKEFQDLYEKQAEALERVLVNGIRRGEVRKTNPHAVARLVYDTTRGAIAQRILGWSRRSPREDAELVFEVLWRGIGCV
jgi:TetR/AcrR family fatty acid metabolism transcriptional regulator